MLLEVMHGGTSRRLNRGRILMACLGNPHNTFSVYHWHAFATTTSAFRSTTITFCSLGWFFWCTHALFLTRSQRDRVTKASQPLVLPFIVRRSRRNFCSCAFCMRRILLLSARRPFIQTPDFPRRLLWNTVSSPSPWIQRLTRSLATTKMIRTATPQKWYVCCDLRFSTI